MPDQSNWIFITQYRQQSFVVVYVRLMLKRQVLSHEKHHIMLKVTAISADYYNNMYAGFRPFSKQILLYNVKLHFMILMIKFYYCLHNMYNVHEYIRYKYY